MKMRIFTEERVIEFKVANRKELISEAIPAAETMMEDGDAYYAEVVYDNGWTEVI
jgi:hypothetical protein